MKTYIIHVSDDYERERHMNSQLEDKNLDVTFIIDGDKKDLSEKVLSTYFTGNRKNASNSTSCVYKHILAYEQIVKDKAEVALVLEDDIIFYKNFSDILGKITAEIKKDNLEGFIISLEDSLLRYINRSARIKNKFIYAKEKGRFAGAYLIDLKAANNMLELIKEEKCHIPMDWYHNYCQQKNLVNIFWSQPTIAVQKSMTGSMSTLIDDKTSGVFRVISFYMQRVYKRLLYNLR